ncbi:Magnesium transport protein CorA, transmembrane region [Glarea lozoyensis ATCC 20868]|uniref:Magnesium transport protein CorA, transmembrane region n=1 Tax=Glarea lozoyensis (strain ATCC 20868 / MF5171) TaxID=1116229 RepID=S3DV65_GLAL2|nr:Magnesium transport protein CorA, transmembrane region [Glarea lozoyensis ATCC 20868]EPE35811.1 Magnesium transport protein CorA, transmembrane region [Glarea lozoyensis ATCC 20868]
MPYLHWEIQSNLDDLEDLLATRHHHTFPPGIRNVETKFQFLIDQAKRNWSFYYSRIDEWKHQHSKSSATCRTRSPLGEYLLHVAKFYRSFNLDADTHLLSDQLFAIPPLHPRRTLHQSYYWKRTHTGYLDRHQTTHKATDTDDYSHQGVGKVIMVDQLWMYILDENTIITFFPQRAGRNLSDSSNVHATIHSVLENVQRGHINSVHDLALLIMNECSAVFFDRGKADERPELLNIFSIALGDISESMRLTLEGFHTYVERVEHNYEDPYADLDVSSRRTLGTGHEVLLTKRLHDILDELRMMARIITQQEQVTSDYQEHLSAIHDQIRTTETHVFEEPVKSEMMEKLKDRNNASKIMTSEFTLLNVRRLARTIAKRGKELQELVTTADNLLHQLKDHVNLKQQHASIMEAQYASQVAQEGMKQNRTFLLFTIVIIIFLPLSFMSSLFGMNASDFQTSDGKNSMSLQQQLNFLFPISTVIIAISIAFAFSLRFRHPFYYMLSCLSICWSYFTAYTYIHRLSFRYPRRPIGQMTKDHQKVIKAVHKKGENAELWRRMRRDLERAESEPTKSTKR